MRHYLSSISVLLIAMKKDTHNRLNAQTHLNTSFNNITIYNSKYVKVSSIKITIPFYYSEDSCIFSTNNTQLIHMMIDRCEIERNLPYGEWEQTVRSILFKQAGIKDTDLDQFINWNLGGISFSLARYSKCTKKEICSFRFHRADQRSEILSGNDKVVFQQYVKASHHNQDSSVPNYVMP